MWDKVFKYAGEVAKLYDIETTCTSHSRRKRPPRCFDDSLLYQSTGCREELTTSDELKQDLYFPVLDVFLVEIDKRFDKKIRK